MIKEKFIQFKNKEDFVSNKGVGDNIDTPTSGSEENGTAIYGQVDGKSIVFIRDSKEIWTHGNLYKSVNWSVLEEKYKMVDLGLPSGLLWADRNIGADCPEDAGLYFQWGDTVGYTTEQITNGEKEFSAQFSDYFDATVDGRNVIFHKYNFEGGFTVIQPEDDAATVNMGAKYRMPTKEDFEELINNCTLAVVDTDGNEYEVIGGKVKIDGKFKGVKFTGSNGNSIFIPLSYYVENGKFSNEYCYLWSSMLSETTYYTAMPLLATKEGTITIYNVYRTAGMPVRGVKSNN